MSTIESKIDLGEFHKNFIESTISEMGEEVDTIKGYRNYSYHILLKSGKTMVIRRRPGNWVIQFHKEPDYMFLHEKKKLWAIGFARSATGSIMVDTCYECLTPANAAQFFKTGNTDGCTLTWSSRPRTQTTETPVQPVVETPEPVVETPENPKKSTDIYDIDLEVSPFRVGSLQFSGFTVKGVIEAGDASTFWKFLEKITKPGE